MTPEQLPPPRFVEYQALKGQEDVLRKEAAAMLKHALRLEQEAEQILTCEPSV